MEVVVHADEATFHWSQDTESFDRVHCLYSTLHHKAPLLCYCRNVHPTWVKFNSKDTKESERWFEVMEY